MRIIKNTDIILSEKDIRNIEVELNASAITSAVYKNRIFKIGSLSSDGKTELIADWSIQELEDILALNQNEAQLMKIKLQQYSALSKEAESLHNEAVKTLENKIGDLIISECLPYHVGVRLNPSELSIEIWEDCGVDLYLTNKQIQKISEIIGTTDVRISQSKNGLFITTDFFGGQ